jgi:hypothetical protein
MCQPEEVKTTTIPIHKPPGSVVMHVFLSSFCFFFVIVALLIPTHHGSILLSEEPNTTTPAPTTAVAEAEAAPKRGKFIGANFDAHDLYNAYKEIQSEYHQKAFSAATQSEWKILTRREDAEVAMMEHSSDPDCPYVRLTAIIPTPVEDCWNFLLLSNWEKSMPQMDPFYEGVELYGDFTFKNVHMILARKRTQRILAFGKCDFVFLSVTDEPLDDGTWVSGTVSVRTPNISRQMGYTRAFQDFVAFYKPLDNRSKTKVTIVCRIDLNDSSADCSGGWMPMWLYVKTIGATGARSVFSMRNVLVEEQNQKLLLEEQQLQQRTTKKKKKKKKSLMNILPFWKKIHPQQQQEGKTKKTTATTKKWRLRWGEKEQEQVKKTTTQPKGIRWFGPRLFGFGQS